MPEQPKTDPKLIERLEQAAKHDMTPAEIRRQRVSFVYGNLPHEHPMTKLQVAAAIARLEGEVA